MRWLHSVGMVQRRRTSPDLKEILSGGVGLVRSCRIRLWDESWDFWSHFIGAIGDTRTGFA
jgi:hypothetical protein